MGKTIFYIAIILLQTLPAFSQSISDTASTLARTAPDTTNFLRTLRAVKGSFNLMEVDALQNLYLISAKGQLKKLSSAGDSVAVYNDVKNLGVPGSIAVANPLQVLAYFPNYSTVVILDRLLNPRATLNLRSKNMFSVSAVAPSYDNNIWVFDEQNLRLKKLDETGKILLETNDLRMFMNELPQPEKIIDAEYFVYLYDEEKGFFIFDRFGTFKQQLKFKNWKFPGVSGTLLYGFENNILQVYDQQTLQQRSYPQIKSTGTKAAAITGGNLYLLEAEGVKVYQMFK